LDVGEQNEPPIPRSRFQFACTFSAANAASGILATDTYTKEEPIRRERSKQTMDVVMVAIGTSRESGKQNDDDGRA
jgi:hypothetical protein